MIDPDAHEAVVRPCMPDMKRKIGPAPPDVTLRLVEVNILVVPKSPSGTERYNAVSG